MFPLRNSWITDKVGVKHQSTNIKLYHGQNKLHFWWDNDNVCFALGQHAEMYLIVAAHLAKPIVLS